jgi:hypothetical protein
MRILFLHGWNSAPGGVKLTYLKDQGHEVVHPALPHEDFAETVRIIGRERYYRVLQPEVRKAYPCEDALLLAIRSRHDGPWDDTGQRRE